MTEKFRSGHVYVRMFQGAGAGFVSAIFKEPLFKIDTLRNMVGQYRYEFGGKDLLESCPPFVSPKAWQELHFPKGLWQSVVELAGVVRFKALQQQENKQEQDKEDYEDLPEPLEASADLSAPKQPELSSNVILIDFEASLVSDDAVLPSELGVARV